MGVVRLGVAPDHPKIKAVSRAFEKIARGQGFRFFGNVEVGSDVDARGAARLYDAVVYAVGAQADRRLGIPGEDLPGSWAATEFVAWYNGHPDFQDREFDLSGERAVVIGNGNVAVDVARMLALTEEELAPTDTTDEAIAAIVGSGIERDRRCSVAAGRRRRRSRRPSCRSSASSPARTSSSIRPIWSSTRRARRRSRTTARRAPQRRDPARVRDAQPTGKPKRLVLRFCVSPGRDPRRGRVEAIEVVRNELVADDAARIRAEPTASSR